MELITNDSISKLPVGLQQFAKSRIGHKAIKDSHPNEVLKLCGEIINLAFMESGQTGVTAEMLNYNKDVLFNEVKGKYSILTMPEVRNAFRMGVRGEFGAWFGMCAKTYHQWLKCYSELPQRTESMRVFLQLTNEVNIVSKQPSEEEKEQIMKSASLQAFKDYKESKTMPFICAPVYDYLRSKGLINWTKEEKQEIQAEVKSKYLDEMKQSRNNGQISIIQYQNIVNNLSGDLNKTLISKVKNYALKLYFNNLIIEGKELEI